MNPFISLKKIILVAFAFFSVIEAETKRPEHESQTQWSCWAPRFHELWVKHHDVTGSRTEILRGTSILPAPSLDLNHLGLPSYLQKSDFGASGLFANPMAFSAWNTNITGQPGLLSDQENRLPDTTQWLTPRVSLNWERGPFSGNAFRLNFQRALTRHAYFYLGVNTQSVDSSGSFRYQDITHQPYLGTLKRDSSSIPFSGVNLQFDSFDMNPRIVYRFPNATTQKHLTLTLQTRLLRQRFDEVTRYEPQTDSLDSWQTNLVYDPVSNKQTLSSLGGILQGRWKQWESSLQYHLSNWSSEQREIKDIRYHIISENPDDTLWSDSLSQYRSRIHQGQFSLRHQPSNLELTAQSEGEYLLHHTNRFMQLDSGHLWQDRSLLGLKTHQQKQGKRFHLQWQGQLLAQRWGTNADTAAWAPSISSTLNLSSSSWSWESGVLHSTVWPSLKQLYCTNLGRLTYPNASLQGEVIRTFSSQLSYRHNKVTYGIRARREQASHAIRLGWMQSNRDTLSNQEALTWQNIDRIENLSWAAWMEFQLGYWWFYLERESVLDQDLQTQGIHSSRVWNTPTRLYKGSIIWRKNVVNERLGLWVRWDFQWFGEQWDIALEPKTEQAYRVKLSKYLVLDFEARMRILSFDLYTRIENLNHSQLQPGVGYAPPGVTFRYGILWYLDG